MKRLILCALCFVNFLYATAQSPVLWGTAKSTINSDQYIIYKTDTALSGPVIPIKTFNAPFDGVPYGSLVKGLADTLIYGATNFTSGAFSLFQLNTVTNHYSIKYQVAGGALGESIVGELMRHPNGKYYGMTNSGGNYNKGVIFEWDALMNVYSVKHHFNGTDGGGPRSNASLRYCTSDGYFYGLTELGGSINDGVLFRYNPVNNVYQVVQSFNYSNGVEPNSSVQIIEFPNGDLNILYTLMYGNSNNWGTLCNTRYTNSSGTFTTTFQSFSGLYFYNNALQLSNPIGDIVKLNTNNINNDVQFIGVAGNSSQNSYVIYSFALDDVTKQIYTNTSFQFLDYFPTHPSIRTADMFVQSNLSNGVIYGVTNGTDVFNTNGSYIRKYAPLSQNFDVSLNIQSLQNYSNAIFGGRPYIQTFTPCVSATTPVISSTANNVCDGEAVTLSINSGMLNESANWKWYSGSCGGNIIGEGSSITVNQSATTTYFARGEGGCAPNGSCGTITITCVPGGTELFFSEYIEGSGNNKALEIYNPSASPINLSDYKVELYANGSSTPTNTQLLSGTLGGGSVFVLTNTMAATEFTSIADITSSVCNFNGDDAIVLKKNNAAIDIIGVVGVDPGANWTIPSGGATSGFTLLRNADVTAPETNWNVSQTQWNAYPENTSSFLGFHNTNNTVGNSQPLSDNICLYPNPGNGIFYLKNNHKSEVQIINCLGQVIPHPTGNKDLLQVDISLHPSGIYYLKCNGEIIKYIKF